MKPVLALLPRPQVGSQNVHCWRISENEQISREIWSADFLNTQKGAQCVLMVPAMCLSWHRIFLPKNLRLRGDARLLPVLKGLVEDFLLDNVEDMHLALQPNASAGTLISVAACNKAWLEHWLQIFERSGLRVLRVIPEIAPEGLGEQLWAVGSDHDVWVAGAQENIPVTVPLLAAGTLFTPEVKVNALPCFYTPIEKILGENRVQLLSEKDWYENQLKNKWNLAQYELAGRWLNRCKRKIGVGIKTFFHANEWRAARLALMTLGLGLVLVLNLQAWRQKQVQQQLREAIAQTVQKTFPNISLVIDAPLQMQREVEVLRRTHGILSADDFEPMAAVVGEVLGALKVHVSAIKYSPGQLVLDGVAAVHLQAIDTQLSASGYRAELEGSSIRVQEIR